MVQAIESEETYFWQVIVCHNDDCSSGVQTTTSSAARHLRVFARKDLPETAAIMFPYMREDDRLGRHVYTLTKY